jgi:hypothetical protein
MSKYPTPTREGHFWAKLALHENDDLRSTDWEVVQVFDNNGEGEFAFLASVPGIEGGQPIDAFVWGPAVLKPEELR